MLRSARRHYDAQRALSDRARALGRRAWLAGGGTASLALLQRQAAEQSAVAVEQMLAEQGIAADPEGQVSAGAFAGVASDGSSLTKLVGRADSEASMVRLFGTQVADAGRVAAGVGIAARPSVQGYVRTLSGASCARCVILAGRFYRWSAGFARHPGCDCVNTPTNQGFASDLTTDPMAAFRAGRVRGLSQADTEAINAGADIGRVVNVRRRAAGLSVAGRVLSRGARPMPEGIYRAADNRADAIRLLERHGFITT